MNRRNNWKFTSTMVAGIFLAILTGPSSAQLVDTLSCGPEASDNVVHFDKIIFRAADGKKIFCPGESIDPLVEGTFKIKDNTWMDIKVLDDPFSVADVAGKVVYFLNESGCTQNEKDLKTNDVAIIDVEYAVVCASPKILE